MKNPILLVKYMLAFIPLLLNVCTTNAQQSVGKTIAVDLGLSVKWADRNVGAVSPDSVGTLFSWGEIIPKNEYSTENYLLDNKKNGIYNRSVGSDISGTVYDAAHECLGDMWRLPTKEEFEELLNNCNYQWTEKNGVKGGLFTSKKNGCSIFIPAMGICDGKTVIGMGIFANCWSSIVPGGDRFFANALYLCNDDALINYRDRYLGLPIRPVCNE